MRKRKGFVLRQVCGENIIISEGIENIDFSKLISMNSSSVYLWEALGDSDFDYNDIANLLIKEYDIDMDTAIKDAQILIGKWLDAQIIE